MTSKAKVEELWPKGLHDQSKPYFMPIIELREIIRKLEGWKLDDGGLQYLDLARAFRDAAYKEQFEVWGKKLSRNSMFRSEEISQEVPKIYWIDATLDMFTFPSETENEAIVTHIMDPSKRELYRSILTWKWSEKGNKLV